MEYLLLAMVALSSIIVAGMLFLKYLAIKYNNAMQKRRMNAIDQESPYRKAKRNALPKLTDDFRSKDRGLEKIRQEREYGAVEKYNTNEVQDLDSKEIVGIAEPVGRWTKFVTQQKMGWLIAMQGLKGKGTFWQNIIKAQASSSRGHSKGR